MTSNRFGYRQASRKWLGGLLLFAAMVLALGVQPSTAQERRGRKFDKQLRERIRQAEEAFDEDTPVRVIVKTRRDARDVMAQKLRARGRVKSEFGIINGSAMELSARQLKALENDPDVESVSIDADVATTGVATAISGSALNSGYSLRSALGLRGVSSTATTTSFQRGNSAGYASTIDTAVDLAAPSTAYGTASSVYVEGFGSTPAGMLVKFDNIIGSGAGQIPAGSTITSASLRIRHLDAGPSTASLTLHRALVPWDGSVTWNSMTTSGPGLQFDNQEVASTADASVSGLATAGTKTFSSAAMAAAVQAWANGAPNHGWVVFMNQTSYLRTSTSEDTTLANRPLLTVTYKAPVNTTALTGAGVTVAVIDSGLFEDGGGTSRIKTTRDFTTGQTNPAHVSPVDAYGHGTHIAALIGGDKSEVEGVAPGVKFVSLRVLNSLGVGTTSHVINAIQWAVANKATYGIDVLNVSLGHPIFERAATDPLVQAVEAAVRSGITVVVAAGNIGMNLQGQIGYGGITSPGNAPSAITVGAQRTMGTTKRQDDLVSDFSSRGPTWYDAFAKPDIIAPGQYVLGAATTSQLLYQMLPMTRGQSFGGRAYLNLSGTSMSAGVVSGTVALMIEQAKLSFGVRPTSNTIKAMLMRSAIPLTNAQGVRYDVLTQGAGSLNARAATQLAAALKPNAALNASWVYAALPSSTVIDGQTISLNDNVVWGTKVLYGGSLDTRLSAWNDNVVWGTNDNVVWGTSLPSYTSQDNVVWGTNAGWDDNVVWGTGLVNGTSMDNVVWGTLDDNVVWGTNDNVVWGTTILSIQVF